MKNSLTLIVILFAFFNASGQELSFEETLSYIQDKISGSIYEHYYKDDLEKQKPFYDKEQKFTHKNSCVFVLNFITYYGEDDDDPNKFEFVLDFSNARIKPDDNGQSVTVWKDDDDGSVRISDKRGTQYHTVSYMRISFNSTVDRDRVLKALKHLQSLCPKDPFD